MDSIAIIDAPSNLGLRRPDGREQPGCYLLPNRLRAEGIIQRCAAHDGGSVAAPAYTNPPQPEGTEIVRGEQIADYSHRLAKKVAQTWDNNSFPLLLGGDCSIIVGAALALRRRGRYGLIAVDGPDFRHPGNSPAVGTAAGESLALVTGRGHAALSDIDGLGPYIADSDVALIGMRDDDDFRTEVEATFTSVRSSQVSDDGVQAAARKALWNLSGVDGFWLHVDADVLDPTVMPAVDTPEPGGLSWQQLGELLTIFMSSPNCIGMDVTILDPELDPEGTYTRKLADLIVEAAKQRANAQST